MIYYYLEKAVVLGFFGPPMWLAHALNGGEGGLEAIPGFLTGLVILVPAYWGALIYGAYRAWGWWSS